MPQSFAAQAYAQVASVLSAAAPSLLLAAAICTALSPFARQACNPAAQWWRNRGLLTDACYALIAPFLAPYLRAMAMLLIAAALSGVASLQDIGDYIEQGRGPLSALPFYAGCAAYLLLSDFLLYWTHRLFHARRLWPVHAVHHSAEDVDWTTAYRFHPANLVFGSYLVTAAMIFLGVSPRVILFLAPFDTAYSYFVHANLNWTLGPFRFVLASPVFHRWHHTSPKQGGDANFAPTFAFWDVLFGTFYMPANQLPQAYGVDDPDFPQDYIGQFLHPFRGLLPSLRRAATRG